MLAAPAANQLLVPAAAAASSGDDGSWLSDLLDCSGISDALHSNRTLDQNRNPSIMPLRFPLPCKTSRFMKRGQVETGSCEKQSSEYLPGVTHLDSENNLNCWSESLGDPKLEEFLPLADSSSVAEPGFRGCQVPQKETPPVACGIPVSGAVNSSGYQSRDSSLKGPVVSQEPVSSFGNMIHPAGRKGFVKSDSRNQSRLNDVQNNNSATGSHISMAGFDENKNSSQLNSYKRDGLSSGRAGDAGGAVARTPLANRKEVPLAVMRSNSSRSDTGSTPTSPVRTLKVSRLTPPSSAKSRSMADARQTRCPADSVKSSSSAAGKNITGSALKELNSSPARCLDQVRLTVQQRAHSTESGSVSQSAGRSCGGQGFINSVEPSAVKTSAAAAGRSYGLRSPKVTQMTSNERQNEQNHLDMENGNRLQPSSAIPSLLSAKPPSSRHPAGRDANENFESEILAIIRNEGETGKRQSRSAKTVTSSVNERGMYRQMSAHQTRKGLSKLVDGYQSETTSQHLQDFDCMSSRSVPSGFSNSGKNKLRSSNLLVKSPVSPPPVPVRCQSLSSESALKKPQNPICSSSATRTSKQLPESLTSSVQETCKSKKSSRKETEFESAKCFEYETNQHNPQLHGHMTQLPCHMTQESTSKTAAACAHHVVSTSSSVSSGNHLGFTVSMLSPRYTSNTDKLFSNLPHVSSSRQDRYQGSLTDTGCSAENTGYSSDVTGSGARIGYLAQRDISCDSPTNDSINDTFATPSSSRYLYKSFRGAVKSSGEAGCSEKSLNEHSVPNTNYSSVAQTPKLSSRSKMVHPSVYSQGVSRHLGKNTQQSSVAVKENWQRYCIPSTNASQLSAECGSVERATLPKIGKMVKGSSASFIQDQVCTSGKAGLGMKMSPGMHLRETGCLTVEQNSQQDKCFRKDTNTNKESVTHLSLQGSKQKCSDVQGGVPGLCNALQSSGFQSFSAGTKAKNSGHGLSSFVVLEDKEHTSRAVDRDRLRSMVCQIPLAEAGYGSEQPGSQLAGPPCSNQMANIKQKHFTERSVHDKCSISDRKLNENSGPADALSAATSAAVGGGGMYYLPQALMNCYQQSHPATSRCSMPGNGSMQGFIPTAENHGYYSVTTETSSMPSCVGEGVPPHSGSRLISAPVSTGSRDLTSSGELIPSEPPNTKTNTSVGLASDSLGGAVRPSSPRLLSCRDDDVHGSLLSLISNVSSVYSVAEEKQTQEIYKLKRELDMAHEKINTLTTQLSTNGHVVAAFEQSLSNMTRRLQKLMSTSEQKDAELNELKATLQQIQIQSNNHFGSDFLRRQSSTLLSSPGSDKGDHGAGQCPVDIMSSLTSLSSAGQCLSETSASLDKKHKKKSWLKSSITKAFGRKKSKSWIDSETNPVVIPVDFSAQKSPFAPGSHLSSSLDASVQDVIHVGGGDVTAGGIGVESVMKLQQQLHEKDLKLTDIQLEALSSAHQLEQLKETMNRMKGQIISLKAENDRMQRIMELKGEISRETNNAESSQKSKLNLGGPTNFDSIAMDTTNKDGGKFYIAVQMGSVRHSNEKNKVRPSRVLIGMVEVTNRTNWDMLDSNIRHIFKEYVSRLEPGTSMGLSGSSILYYRIGEIRRSKGHKVPELLPCGYLVGDNTSIIIVLRGSNENSIDSLVFETLVPRSILQRYISLLMEHRRMIMCGPSGTGKTYLAQKLAEHLVQVSGKERSSNAIVTFNVDHKSSKELRQYLSNIADQCENAANDLPNVIILDNLQHVGSLGEAFNAFLGVDMQLCPYIIGTMTQTGSTVSNLQLHHNFRWVLCPSHLEPVRGFLGRFLQRRLIEEEVASGMRNPELARIAAWLPKVWQNLNKFLETYSSSDVTIGPRLFLTCPIDIVTSQTWFADLWNYSIIPYLLEAVREGLQVHGHRVKWENPTEWVIQSSPWTERMQKRDWPSLLHLRPEDVGYDSHGAASGSSASSSRATQNDMSSNDGQDPLVTLMMRLQEAATLSGALNNDNSDSTSLDSHDSELESRDLAASRQGLNREDKDQSSNVDRIESTI